MDTWSYQGKYKGHVWDDVTDELSFTVTALEHAYARLIDAPLTTRKVSEAKQQMDEAIDRSVRAMFRAQMEIQSARNPLKTA